MEEPEHPVSTWLPLEVLGHWEQSHNHQDRAHSGAGSAQAGLPRTATWGIGLVWVGFDQGDGAEVPVEATCTLHSSGLLGESPLGSCK